MDVFALDMMIGETNGLFAGRMKTLGQAISQKEYSFDVRNDDGRGHFRRISRRYPSLHFVLAYGDPNMGEFGSYLIRAGRSQWYLVPEGVFDEVLSKHGYDFDCENDEDDNEVAYTEAAWELMEQTEVRWLDLVYKRLGLRRSAKR